MRRSRSAAAIHDILQRRRFLLTTQLIGYAAALVLCNVWHQWLLLVGIAIGYIGSDLLLFWDYRRAQERRL